MISSRPASSAMLSVMGRSGRALMKRARGTCASLQEEFRGHLINTFQLYIKPHFKETPAAAAAQKSGWVGKRGRTSLREEDHVSQTTSDWTLLSLTTHSNPIPIRKHNPLSAIHIYVWLSRLYINTYYTYRHIYAYMRICVHTCAHVCE